MNFKLIAVLIVCILGVPALAAGGGDGVPVGVVLSQLANLSLLVGVIFYSQRKTIAHAFRQKKENFLENVNAASKSKKLAEAKLAEVTNRVQNMETSFQQQIQEAEKNAEESFREQVADARNAAERVKSMAQSNLEYEIQREVESLRIEAFQKSANLAEKKMEKDLTSEQLKLWNSKFSKSEGAH